MLHETKMSAFAIILLCGAVAVQFLLISQQWLDRKYSPFAQRENLTWKLRVIKKVEKLGQIGHRLRKREDWTL
jgi:hypothetical protein